MSREKIKVTLSILDNNYPLMCEAHERNLLIEAAELLNGHLQDLRSANPKLPHDRLIVMGGLQMAFDLLQERQTISREVKTVNQTALRLLESLKEAEID